ncbi:MAG: YdcF family protein [Bacteroidota bacterium]|nr:YdcF family protein [Bacteroidota bacterium]
MIKSKQFDFLCVRDELQLADVIIGFGHFDPKIPQTCAELFQKGFATYIIFTGGVGAGSTGISQPEALFFKDKLLQKIPGFPIEKLILETDSTNTGENIRNTKEVLNNIKPPLSFGKDFKKVILVANAYRQLRVCYTFKMYYPDIQIINYPPQTSYNQEKQLFESVNESLDDHINGELLRIQTYPSKGFMAACEIPLELISSN